MQDLDWINQWLMFLFFTVKSMLGGGLISILLGDYVCCIQAGLTLTVLYQRDSHMKISRAVEIL